MRSIYDPNSPPRQAHWLHAPGQDVEAGSYFLEVLKMPQDPMDMEAYNKMDRTPHYRARITVSSEDVEHNVKIEKQ